MSAHAMRKEVRQETFAQTKKNPRVSSMKNQEAVTLMGLDQDQKRSS
jgi:hypothetical protein